MGILKSHADKFEQGGIDEAYLDVSSKVRDSNDAAEFAKSLREEVLDIICICRRAGSKSKNVIS
jgi:nucleotidyltransferase/DNA polymerase involved in DNA repair